MAVARKLWVIFATSLSEALQYRVESFVWFCWDVFPPAVMLFIWSAAFRDQGELAGMTFPQMATYYVVVLVFNTLVTVHVEHSIMRYVREGSLSPLLLRPFPVPVYLITGELAWKAMRLVFLVPGVALLALLFPGVIATGPSEPAQWGAFLVSAVLAFVICSALKLLIGASAFWLTEAVGMLQLYEVLTFVFGGLILPIAILPGLLQRIAWALPFRHQYATPVAFYLGQVEGGAALTLLLDQAVWAVGLLALGALVWRLGLRQYESVGG